MCHVVGRLLLGAVSDSSMRITRVSKMKTHYTRSAQHETPDDGADGGGAHDCEETDGAVGGWAARHADPRDSARSINKGDEWAATASSF